MNYIFYPKCEKNILFPLVGESEYWHMSIIRQQQEQLHAMYLDSTGYRIQCKIHSKNQIQTICSKYNSMLLDATDKSSNIYITAQTMRTEYSRKSTNVFELRDLYIDLDPRRKDLSDDETKEVCNNSLLVIGNLITEGILACPTFMVFSGSGIQVHWMLKEPIYYKQTKAMTYFDDVQTDLFCVVADALEKSELPVLKPDKAVIGDHARLLRLAGTINQKNGRMTRLINVFKDEGGELYTYCLKEIVKPNNHADKTQGEGFANRKKKSKIITPQKNNRKCFLKGNYKYILCNRIAKLERLQELRNTSGSTPYRELLCFVYYNTSKAIWGAEEAKERSLFFNDRFNTPLSESEVIGTIKRSDANTKEEVYYWKNEKLIDVLNISESEVKELKIGNTKAKRREAEEKRIIRDERNKRIVDTIISTSLTYDDIAEMFHLSVRRIKEIAKQNGIHRYNKKVIKSTNEFRNGIREHINYFNYLVTESESALLSLISNKREMVDKQEGYLSSTKYKNNLGICPWHMLIRNALDVVGASP